MPDIKKLLEELFTKHKIISVTCDSRNAEEGCAYFAISGSKNNGNDFINEARTKGAKLIFSDNSFIKVSQELDDEIILVDNIRYALSIAAGIIYPNLPATLISVTGTNGKTSVVSYCYSILSKLGIKAASIGTIGVETNCYDNDLTDQETNRIVLNKEFSKSNPPIYTGGLTTADPVAFRRNLHELVKAGVEVIAFEASSHGLHQDRLGDVKVDAAAFVSFSQDHLDYHGSMDNYLNAKLKLFKNHLKPNATAILPSDINNIQEIISFFEEHSIRYNVIDNRLIRELAIDEEFAEKSEHRTRVYFNVHEDSSTALTTSTALTHKLPSVVECPKKSNVYIQAGGSLEDKVSVQIYSIDSSINGQKIEFYYSDNSSKHNVRCDDKYLLDIPMIGSFQANNVIFAIELLRCTGFDKEKLIDAARLIEGVTGRLQRISKLSDDRHIFVDYAHTPDALEQSLIELKKIKHNNAKLIVVFGCGGDRDKTKRPMMGNIAADIADITIITDDNPRYEDAGEIRRDIILGIKQYEMLQVKGLLYEISGRGEAIEFAINMMHKGDIVLIAGKGHEDYQIIKENILKFSDILTVQDILSRIRKN